MSIEKDVQQVVEKQHLQPGDKVEHKAAAHMMDDVLTMMRKESGGAQVSTDSAKQAASLLQKELKAFGVTDLEIVDSNNDGKITKSDKISVSEGRFVPDEKQFNVGKSSEGPVLGNSLIERIVENHNTEKQLGIQRGGDQLFSK